MNTQYITDIDQAKTVLADANLSLITFSHSIGYDTGLSQMYYDEFISNADGCHDIQKFEDYLVIYGSDVSKNDKHFTQDELLVLTDDELINLYDSLGLYHYDLDDKDDLIDELLDLDHEDFYIKYYAETYYRDLDYTFSFNGYSQGDSYLVQTVGNVESWLNDDYLTHIFYDAPISGNIEIYVNGDCVNEISIYEFIKDEYAYWDKDDFISQLSDYAKDLEYKDLLIEYMQDNLLNHLDYDY